VRSLLQVCRLKDGAKVSTENLARAGMPELEDGSSSGIVHSQ